ncbi:hypothetical protein [Caulobacter sp.]|jgi:hypothetical protein|uniref:hypothetical protein n=1 Tax=Caulobacter sp. TaxID=78 RepID=UPI0016145DB6
MSFLSGLGGNLFSSVASIALQGALGVATGGASLLVTTALKGLMMSIGDQLLQNIGQKLGLPQPVIDLAQATFHAAAGNPGGAVQNIGEASQGLASAAGLDQFGAGEIESKAFNVLDMLQNNVQEKLENGSDEDGNVRGNAKTRAAGGAAGGESFLVRLALALGKAIDAKMDEQLKIAGEIDEAKNAAKDGDKGADSQITQQGAKLTALGQEITILSNALNTALKSIGESVSTLARKQ